MIARAASVSGLSRVPRTSLRQTTRIAMLQVIDNGNVKDDGKVTWACGGPAAPSGLGWGTGEATARPERPVSISELRPVLYDTLS